MAWMRSSAPHKNGIAAREKCSLKGSCPFKKQEAFTVPRGVRGMGCAANASHRAASGNPGWVKRLERNVRAQFQHARAAIVVGSHIGKTHWAGGTDVSSCYETARCAPVLVVEEIQRLSLEGKLKSLG